MVVPVLIMSCQVVEKRKVGPVNPQMAMMTIASVKAHALPSTIDERLAKIRNESLTMQKKSRFSSCSLSFSLSVFICLIDWFEFARRAQIPGQDRHSPARPAKPGDQSRPTRGLP